MTSLFLQVVMDWELAAVAVTLILSAYLISNLLASILLPPPERRYRCSPTFPMVSVVLPADNEPEAIVRASIASWKAVRYPAFEIILADDSTVPLELDDTTVRVVTSDEPRG